MTKKKKDKKSTTSAFMKVGALGFGGGSAVIPIIEKECVDERKILSEKEFEEDVVVASITPGALPIKLGASIGLRKSPLIGASSALITGFVGAFLTLIVLILIVAIGDTFLKQIRYLSVGVSVFIMLLITSYIKKILHTSKKEKFFKGAILLFLTALLFTSANKIFTLLCYIYPFDRLIYPTINPFIQMSSVNFLLLALFMVFSTRGKTDKSSSSVISWVLCAILGVAFIICFSSYPINVESTIAPFNYRIPLVLKIVVASLMFILAVVGIIRDVLELKRGTFSPYNQNICSDSVATSNEEKADSMQNDNLENDLAENIEATTIKLDGVGLQAIISTQNELEIENTLEAMQGDTEPTIEAVIAEDKGYYSVKKALTMIAILFCPVVIFTVVASFFPLNGKGYSLFDLVGNCIFSTVTTFGGGTAYLSVAESIFVEKNFISSDVFWLQIVPIASAMPGAIMIKVETAIAFAFANAGGIGLFGSIIYGLMGFSISIFFSVSVYILIYIVYKKMSALRLFGALKQWLMPVICGLLVPSLLSMLSEIINLGNGLGLMWLQSIVFIVLLFIMNHLLIRKAKLADIWTILINIAVSLVACNVAGIFT